MAGLFYSPSNGQASSEEIHQTLQRQADGYVEASRRSLDSLEQIFQEWVGRRRGDLEKTQEMLHRMSGTRNIEEAFDLYQRFIAERSRQLAEEAMQVPGKIGSVGLNASDIMLRAGFPVPLPVSPMLTMAPALQFMQVMRGPFMQFLRMMPEAQKRMGEAATQQVERAEKTWVESRGGEQRGGEQRGEQQQQKPKAAVAA